MDRPTPLLQLDQGQPDRRTHDYTRHGNTSHFAVLDIATAKVLAAYHQRHGAREFRHFLNTIEATVLTDLDIHIVLDNHGTHTAPTGKRWLAQHPRYHLHFTLTFCSWLNQVEMWFSLLTQRQLRRGVHRSVMEIEAAPLSYATRNNRHRDNHFA